MWVRLLKLPWRSSPRIQLPSNGVISEHITFLGIWGLLPCLALTTAVGPTCHPVGGRDASKWPPAFKSCQCVPVSQPCPRVKCKLLILKTQHNTYAFHISPSLSFYKWPNSTHPSKPSSSALALCLIWDSLIFSAEGKFGWDLPPLYPSSTLHTTFSFTHFEWCTDMTISLLNWERFGDQGFYFTLCVCVSPVPDMQEMT